MATTGTEQQRNGGVWRGNEPQRLCTAWYSHETQRRREVGLGVAMAWHRTETRYNG